MTGTGNSKQNIGFIGMGHMGSPMIKRLLHAGYALTVYDRTVERAQAMGQFGALVAQTPRDLAATSDVIISCVTNDHALEAVMLAPDGALAGVHASSVIIDMSTVAPQTSRHLFQAARAKNVPMIDAAVSGSVPQVEQGSLVIFVGGERETYEYCKPILDVLGQQSTYLGSSGKGTTMKLVVNLLLGLGRQALAEALVLGEKAGLERTQLIDVLKQTAVVSPRQQADLEHARQRTYPADFALALMYKDFQLMLSEAFAVSVPLPMTAAAQQVAAAAMREVGEEDASAIIQFMESFAGISGSS
ncbi:NAD(P)-dependent oxidoreductase [Ktedonospora formicarum]|uniref:Tartronate semialdehyde reductase n=1 Tax=Ktedonospora formicarum TaxID=2778364 RepID=A0A8J3IH97_9CHLR|nr:NAD(P)-dependent oxidoreductase [Ktedonospora formicarum]GHO51099.1 tartronate semialdehyde reductase [Ktedonospora formicarum]